MRINPQMLSAPSRSEPNSKWDSRTVEYDGGKNFSQAMEAERNRRETVATALDGYLASWENSNRSQHALMEKMPRSMRPYIDLQIEMNTLNVQTSILTKAGESVSGTLQRVQQMGGN